MTAAAFLHTLYDHFDEGHLTLFSIGRDGYRHTDWFAVDQIDEMAVAAEAMTDRDVWFGLAARHEPLPDARRGSAVDCLAAPGLWLDIDIAGPNHKDPTGLPVDIDEARALIERFPLRPSIIVHSGGGLHVYWLLAEPAPSDEMLPLLERWAETWSQIAAKMKLRVDNVFDLPRVLRVPGTRNLKNGGAAPVMILEQRELRYGIDDFEDVTVTPKPRQHRSVRTGAPILGVRPGDAFNQRHTGGYVLGLAGWTLARTDRSGNESWLHPWGPSSDCSATVYAEDAHTTIWSDTPPKHAPVDTMTPYDPYGLYVRLIHDGDFTTASRELALEGYGERPEITIVTMPNGTCRPKKKVTVGARHLDDLANDVVDGLIELNQPPRLFRHGEIVSQMSRDGLEPVDRVTITHIVESSLSPVKETKNGQVPSRIDATALDLTLYRLRHDLPAVEAVVRSPFLRADGTICTDVGYDPSSRLYLASTLPIDVPDQPTPADVVRAVEVVDEMICDFPLETASDRAHVFALLLTLLTRHLVPLAPLFAFDGNGPGVGKNLLSECCVYVATGEWSQTDPLPLDAEEQRKQITATLASGRTVALYDEAHIISGTSLARLITSTTWGDRLLGYSQTVSYPNHLTVIALGNNVEVQGDMPRRTILIRLASPLSRPELRQGFRHDDLRAWVTNNRAGVLGALLTLLRAWVVAGRPPGTGRLGSFDAWASMIAGVLTNADVKGFMDNADEMRARAAVDDDDMIAHLGELHEHYAEWPFSTSEVAEMLTSRRFQTWPPRVANDDRKMTSQLGYAYRKASGRWYGDLMLVKDGVGHAGKSRWKVVDRASAALNAQVGGGDGDDGDHHTSYAQEKSDQEELGDDRHRQSENQSSPSSPSSPHVDLTEELF